MISCPLACSQAEGYYVNIIIMQIGGIGGSSCVKMHISRETERRQQSGRFLHEQQLVLIEANAASALVLDVSSVHQSLLFFLQFSFFL